MNDGDINRFKYMTGRPEKNGWYHVLIADRNSKKVNVSKHAKPKPEPGFTRERWLYRNEEWWGSVPDFHDKKNPPKPKPLPTYWTDDDMLEDTAGKPLHNTGVVTLLEILLNDWRKDYKSVYRQALADPSDKSAKMRLDTLEKELRGGGLINACLCDVEPEDVIKQARKDVNKRELWARRR